MPTEFCQIADGVFCYSDERFASNVNGQNYGVEERLIVRERHAYEQNVQKQRYIERHISSCTRTRRSTQRTYTAPRPEENARWRRKTVGSKR